MKKNARIAVCDATVQIPAVQYPNRRQLTFIFIEMILHRCQRLSCHRGRRTLVVAASAFDPSRVRAISLDVTGTIMVHAEPIMKTYADSAVWAKVPHPPTEQELKPAFKAAYKRMHFDYPCFG